MEKRLIAALVAAAFAGTAGVAMAGSISVASVGTYAAETIGGATTASGIVVGNVSYTLSSPFAPGSTQTVKYSLSGQKILTCPSLTLQPAVLNVTITPPAGPSSDALTCSYKIATGTDPTTDAVPAGTILNMLGAVADASAGKTLADGTPVTAKVEVISSASTVVEFNTADVAIAKQAISAAWQASSPAVEDTAFATAEKSKVNVLASPVLTAFTDDTDATPGDKEKIVIGAFKLKSNSGGPYLDNDGATAVKASTLAVAEFTMTVTGTFAGSSTGVVFASDVATCANNIGDFSISGTTATLTGFDAVAELATPDSPVFVCYEPQAGLAAGDPLRVIPITQFIGSATTKSETAITAKMQGEAAGPTNLYNLGSNGVQVDVRVMTTAATTGWNTVLRIINTGTVAAPISATYIGNDGKAIGTSKEIVGSLAAGATAMLSAADVESALGVTLSASGNPPRLRITAPTTSLRVQSWVQTPNGAWFMGTPAQGDDANKSSTPVSAVETR